MCPSPIGVIPSVAAFQAELARISTVPLSENAIISSINTLLGSKMKLQINGGPRDFNDAPASFTLTALIEALGFKSDRVAVELNRDIVPRDRWTETTLKDGDQLEIVHFVGGGSSSDPLSASQFESVSSYHATGSYRGAGSNQGIASAIPSYRLPESTRL